MDFIRTDVHEDRVAVVTLARPEKLNAFCHQMVSELDAALSIVDDAPDVHAIVVVGAGDRAFSAGLDMTELGSLEPYDHLTRFLDRADQMYRWASLRKPLIAAVNGHAHGAGAILASCADIRVGCASTTFKFSGILGNLTNNTWQLPKVVGLPLATEYVLTGRVVEAEEALAAGLLNRLVPTPEVLTTAKALASQIAKNPPGGVMASKKLLRDSVTKPLREALDAENAIASGILRPLNSDNAHLNWWRERYEQRHP
jgi:2-(1,2-epoxy-1,2-dihydrophenyl)acetyl-CoA isomerase